MKRILVLGGGVGGTLTANLLIKKLRRHVKAGEVSITVVDETGQHTYQPGFMYIAMGGERAQHLRRPERGLLDSRVGLVVGRIEKIDEPAQTVHLADGQRLGYDQLVLATGSRIVPEAIEHFDAEAHHFYTAEAAVELRAALDAFAGGRIVIGIAGMPYKCPPAPLEVAFLIEAELRQRGLREKTELHFCSPIGRAFTIESVSEMATPILEQKGIELHTFFNVEAIDPERKVVQSLEGEELHYDLLILVPPHKGQQFLIDSDLAPAPGGWLPTDRATLQVGGRPNVLALGDATDLPLSKAGSTAHFEAPVITERIVAAIEERPVDPRHGEYLGKVMCFFEFGDNKGTLLQFDYEHPPRPPKPNHLWHLGKIVFNKTYWHTVPKGRVSRSRRGSTVAAEGMARHERYAVERIGPARSSREALPRFDASAEDRHADRANWVRKGGTGMNWDLGLQGLGVLLVMSVAFGVIAQLVIGRQTTRWLWAIAGTTFFVAGLFISEVWFGWATQAELQPNIDGLSVDETLLALVPGILVVVATWFSTNGRHLRPR